MRCMLLQTTPYVLKVTLFKNPVADLSLFQLKMGICNQDTIKQLQSMMENVNEQQKITFQRQLLKCSLDLMTSNLVVEFTSNVKIKSISIVGGADGTSPAKMRAFINRDGIDFSDAQSMQAIQSNMLTVRSAEKSRESNSACDSDLPCCFIELLIALLDLSCLT
ncbi:hypothetical protein Ahy_B06g085771 isoform H [Arachis hypogaea]|uniref:PITH domain-containing protein n=1 Tax=Arachis hypogaea TaxID=3818 RepID=A0A444YVK0_ARAHY|nr:hypothetical protein Ahy_B06g085771 isoform H [Arachis hypogaea]